MFKTKCFYYILKLSIIMFDDPENKHLLPKYPVFKSSNIGHVYQYIYKYNYKNLLSTEDEKLFLFLMKSNKNFLFLFVFTDFFLFIFERLNVFIIFMCFEKQA